MRRVAMKSTGHFFRHFIFVVLLLLAFLLAAQKNFNQSEKATVEKFKRAQVSFNRGVEYLRKGLLAKAQKEAESSMEILSYYSDGYLLLAMIRYQEGNYEAGLAEIERAKMTFGAIKEFYATSYQDYITACASSANSRPTDLPMPACL
jgi:outer membrane protein assembly factor BamD (BamD/ComL family)